MLIAVASILSIAVFGVPLVLAIDREARGGLLAGLAFLYGCGIVHFVLLAFSLAGVRWALLPIQVALLAVSAAMFVVARGRPGRTVPMEAPHRRRDLVSVTVDAITTSIVLLYAAFATAVPMWQWDFWAIWGLKARVFFESGGIDWRFLTREANTFTHPDYPLLVTLQYDYLALFGGRWDDRWSALLTPAFTFALLLVVRSIAAREFSHRVASGVTLAVTAFAVTPYVGLADGPLIAYTTAALLLVSRGNEADLRHVAVLLGLAALTKNEGLALAMAVAIALVAVRRPRDVARLWPAAAITAPWLVLRWLHHLPTDVASGPLLERFGANVAFAPALALMMAETIAEPMIVLLLIAGAAVAASAVKPWKVALIAIAIQFLSYLGAYLVTPHRIAWHVATSWPRISAHLLTPLLVVVMLALAARFELAQDAAHAEAGQER